MKKGLPKFRMSFFRDNTVYHLNSEYHRYFFTGFTISIHVNEDLHHDYKQVIINVRKKH